MKCERNMGDIAAEGQCHFYLIRKHRYCRFRPKEGQKYCPEHACIKGVQGDRKRIPCPLNPSHNCYEDELEKHLKKCNVAKYQQATERAGFYVKGINKGSNDGQSAEQSVKVKDLASEDLAAMITRINKLYEEHVDTMETAIYEHPCLKVEIGGSEATDLSEALGEKAALRKELLQQASLVGQLEELGLLSDDHCFVEMGAGKGKLSHWIQKASKECANTSFVLVERQSVRYKMDSFHKQGETESQFKRIRIDIEDLCLGQVPELKSANSVIVIGKHLCGGGTDMGIRCAVETLAKTRKQEELIESLEAQEPPCKTVKTEQTKRQRLPKGIVIALCCHHQCSWDTYLGKDFIHSCGMSSQDFDLMTRLSSWATCAKVTAKSVKKSQDSLKNISPIKEPAGVISEVSPTREEEAEEQNTEGHRANDLINFKNSQCLREQLSVQEREDIGRKCKRLIDTGRLHYLRSKGLDCFLREYIHEELTPENVVLIACQPKL